MDSRHRARMRGCLLNPTADAPPRPREMFAKHTPPRPVSCITPCPPPVLFVCCSCSSSVHVLFEFCSCAAGVLFVCCSCAARALSVCCLCSARVFFVFCSCAVRLTINMRCNKGAPGVFEPPRTFRIRNCPPPKFSTLQNVSSAF